jgi:hypothetical protein
MFAPRFLSKRGIPSGVNGSVSETAPRPVAPSRQGDRFSRAPSSPCGPVLAQERGANLAISPDEPGPDTLVIDG